MKARTASLVGALTSVAVLVADQVSKSWALNELRVEGASQPLIGPLNATLVFNRSNAFSVIPEVGDLTRWGLVSFNVIVAATLVWWLMRYPHRLFSALGVGFLIAGALGNALDRLRLGYVVDFIDASALRFPWVFNVADAAVDFGIGCLFLSTVILPAIQKRAAASASAWVR